MATINIINGTATQNLAAGAYTATANVTGYSNATITPTNITVTADSQTFNFTIAATGTATITLTDSVTSTPISGATFIRCDATNANQYGTAVTTNASGVATFANLPWGTGAPIVYIAQQTSDLSHQVDTTVKQLTLTTETGTDQAVTNIPAASQTFGLTDANYTGLPITGSIELNL